MQLKLINFESSGGLVPQAPGPQILAYDHQAILISAYDLVVLGGGSRRET